MSSETILLVEDEDDIREIIAFNLEREGYICLQAENGRKALDMVKRHHPKLILLDVMLPEMDGFSVCREVEREPNNADIAIIMLTARGEEVDRIVGLELGADDYVVKPFSMRELLLRIKAILRRRAPVGESPVLTHNTIVMDVSAHRVSVDGDPVMLTATEFRLLEDLLRHKSGVRTREQLLDSVWSYQFEGYARTVDTHIRRVRAKLGASAELLETVRGVGYCLKA